jgi:hypothetical protein
MKDWLAGCSTLVRRKFFLSSLSILGCKKWNMVRTWLWGLYFIQ